MLHPTPYDEWLEPPERKLYRELESALAIYQGRIDALRDQRDVLRTRARVRKHRAERSPWAPR